MSANRASSRGPAPTAATPTNHSRTVLAAALLLLCALVVKLFVLAELHNHPLLQPLGDLDPAYYVDLARQVASGQDAPVGQAFFVSPLYVYFLALVFALTGGSLLAAKIVQVLLGVAAVWLIAKTADEWFGARAGWIAGALAASCGIFTFYEVLLLQAALDPFLTALDLYVLTKALRGGRAGTWVAAGACLGVQVLNRPNVLAYVAPAILALVIVRLGQAANGRAGATGRAALAGACCALGVAMVIAPVAIRNYHASGEVVLVSSHGGLNFYIGNHANADGTFHRVPGITPSIAGQADDAARVAAQAIGHPVGPSEVSNYFFGQAWAWMTSHRGAAARLFVRKIVYVFNAGWLTLNYSYPYYRREASTALALLVVGPWLLLPFGLVGLFVRPRRSTPGASPAAASVFDRWDWAYLGWVSFVPVYAVAVAAFFVSARYRMPLLVPLTVTTAGALDAASRAVSRRDLRRLAVLGGWLAIVAVATNWPLHLDDGLSAERTKMIRYLIGAGEHQAAADLLARTEAEHPHPAVLLFSMGQEYLNRQDPQHALPLLERALTLERDRPETHLSLGQALLQNGRPADAVAHLKTAVDAGYGGARAYEALGLALGMLGRGGEAAAALENGCRLDPANAQARLNLAVVYANMGRIGDARAQAEEAVRLQPGYDRARELLRALPR